MKRKLLFPLTIVLFFCLDSYSQEPYVMLLKGSARMNNKELDSNYRYTLQGKTIALQEDSKIIVFNKNKYVEQQTDAAKNIDCVKLKSFLEKRPIMTSFTGYLMRNYKMESLAAKAKGTNIAGVKAWNQRQLNANGEDISPMDSSRIAVETVNLNWNLKSKVFGGKLYVVHLQSNDTVYKKEVSENGKAAVTLTKNGDYKWFIYAPMGKQTKIGYTFTYLSNKEAQKAKTEFEDFKKQLESLSPEAQEKLIDDYLYFNHLVIE